MREDNEEQPMHPLYSYAYITDAEEGLILTNVDTLWPTASRAIIS